MDNSANEAGPERSLAPSRERRNAEASAEARTWNARHAVGTRVVYWPGLRKGEGITSSTRTPAQALGGHTAVVWVEGRGDCIALTHVEPWRFTTECGCDRYPCDCTGCDCGGELHNPGPGCPGQEATHA